MQQRADGKHFGVMGYVLQLSELYRKKPGTHDMIEEIGLVGMVRVLYRAVYEPVVRNRNTGDYAHFRRSHVITFSGALAVVLTIARAEIR
jgi:hypothetical protein